MALLSRGAPRRISWWRTSAEPVHIDTIERLGAALDGRYVIVRQIGAGGMATVYLARDPRHDREVALKLLRPELLAVLGKERFLSEIRVTAHLQHPHLLPLFDSGEADGFLYYVMPFAEGETLRARLERERQLPIDDALRIAAAVASALDYAHRHGVIHRDLKPENILMQGGEPVVSDFGIALALSHAAGERITQSGISLGTPQYMSPEQATGDRQIDARTDIYSLGCVLYEMLTGDPPHTASTVHGIVAKVLTDKPRSVRATRPAVPPHVESAIERALEKLPADRWASAADFCDALRARRIGSGKAVVVSSDPRAAPSRRALVLGAAAGLVALAAIAGAWRWLRPQAPPAPTVRFVLALPEGQRVRDATGTTLALSRDGTRLAYVGRAGGGRRLYVRQLDQLEARPLPGTEEAASPFFSPDGQWVAFFSEDSKLKKVALAGGAPIDLAVAPAIRGGSWGDDDNIIFAAGDGLLRVSSNGGPVDTLTRPNSISGGALLHSWPEVLPGGDAVAFMATTAGVHNARLGVLSLRGTPSTPKYFDQPCLGPRLVENDRLLCPLPVGNVVAIPFDLGRLEITGRPQTVLYDAIVKGGGAALVAIARNGTVAYLKRTAQRQLMLLDQSGREVSFLVGNQNLEYPRFSPDGRSLAVQSGIPGSTDIWIYPLPNGPIRRLTFGGTNQFPEWSSDGTRVIFSSDAGNGFDLYWQRADGSAPAEPLLIAPGDQSQAVMAPNGDIIARSGSGNGRDLITFRAGDTAVTRLTATPGVPESSPRVSPDGKWLAYFANETGRFEVYVKRLQGEGRWPISLDGGTNPLWSRDGRVLYYWHGTQFITAPIATSQTINVLDRRVLFERNPAQGGHTPYEVAPDNKHFVMLRSVSEDADLVIVLNWVAEWRRTEGTLAPGALRVNP